MTDRHDEAADPPAIPVAGKVDSPAAIAQEDFRSAVDDYRRQAVRWSIGGAGIGASGASGILLFKHHRESRAAALFVQNVLRHIRENASGSLADMEAAVTGSGRRALGLSEAQMEPVLRTCEPLHRAVASGATEEVVQQALGDLTRVVERHAHPGATFFVPLAILGATLAGVGVGNEVYHASHRAKARDCAVKLRQAEALREATHAGRVTARRNEATPELA